MTKADKILYRDVAGFLVFVIVIFVACLVIGGLAT